MSVRHKKTVRVDRPDSVDATIVQGIADWGAPHAAPDMLAYLMSNPSGMTMIMPGTNQPDTEIPRCRSKYDFTFAEQVRLLVGAEYGSAKIFMKYSLDLATWFSFDGIGGPFITQNQGNANPTLYVSPWVSISANAKGDRWVAPFYRQNVDTAIVAIHTIALQVR